MTKPPDETQSRKLKNISIIGHMDGIVDGKYRFVIDVHTDKGVETITKMFDYDEFSSIAEHCFESCVRYFKERMGWL